MKFDSSDRSDPRQDFAVLTLDDLRIGCVTRADTEEGWVEQILTNWYRKEILGWPEVSPEEEAKPVRRYGVVRFEGYCDEQDFPSTPDGKIIRPTSTAQG